MNGYAFFNFLLHIDHNFSKSARINFWFCTVAKLEKLNNFCLDRKYNCPDKKLRFRDFRVYLARARARARAPGPRKALGLRPVPTRGSKDRPQGARACGFGGAAVGFHEIVLKNIWKLCNWLNIAWIAYLNCYNTCALEANMLILKERIALSFFTNKGVEQKI